MRIASVRIQNLRSFKDQTIEFDPYTCLVGPNGSGKSNVFCALNIFFGEDDHSQTSLTTLEEEDFHKKKTDEPIRITVTFKDLSPAAKEDLKAYVRQDQLVVTAVAEWDPEAKIAKVRQVGERKVMAEFAPYFQAQKEGAKAPRLKEIFAELKSAFPEVKSATAMDAMRDSLRAYEEEHPDRCVLMESPDQFYGVSKGDHLLNRHIQWVFVPAIKDAASEHREAKDSALGQLLNRTVRTRVSFKERLAVVKEEAAAKYQAILAESQGALEDLSAKLTEGLAQWATPDAGMGLVWHADRDKSVTVSEPYAEIVATDGAFSGALTRFGHGLQRSYLLALLQLIAAGEGEGEGPTLILGVEEPELFQHPPQARHLANVLSTLSEKGNQVMVCTHSPLFVRGESFENVRLIRRDAATKASVIASCSAVDIEGAVTAARGKASPLRVAAIAKLDQELNPELNELFFAPYIVLVEGTEDIAYIKAHMLKQGVMERFRALGGHFIPVHKKSRMPKPLAILVRLGIPFFCVFDADGDCAKAEHLPSHESDNKTLLTLMGMAGAPPFPAETVWSPTATVWATSYTKVIEADFGPETWEQAKDAVRAAHGCPPNIDKTAYYIPEFLNEAWTRGGSSPASERLVQAIMAGAERR
ncbi:AAA family ATPase [Geothrix mesophila]|uniref:AAA family ATPase n=1 Tax=Geothrix mesophila TaxID=2922723 RepID=UPI001FADC70A|nr:AAA family ATPase [Geothrix sp. SG198]